MQASCSRSNAKGTTQIGNMRKQGCILYVFAYGLDIFAAFLNPIMDSTTGGRLVEAARVWVHYGYGKAANMSKTYASTCKVCLCLQYILRYFAICSLCAVFYNKVCAICYLYATPGALHLAESAAPLINSVEFVVWTCTVSHRVP